MFGLDLLALLVIAFIALVAVVLVVLIVVFSVRASRKRDAASMAGSVGVQPHPGPPATAIEARLRELDSLRARGVISYDEYVSARQRAIDGPTAT